MKPVLGENLHGGVQHLLFPHRARQSLGTAGHVSSKSRCSQLLTLE
ncbi:hypothetical protein RAJCM14343_2289 [Rhodococcus aetherivorans]|uniref:Uncharacterized protein n=1 Tax=Rhodococcus aetherivorans TaxID=191292 RepID=A0ABQ0YKJ0_9NOCA|nr:hypothetical protein RAJCM14343_2289 [Rhodococcus aetherivorans]